MFATEIAGVPCSKEAQETGRAQPEAHARPVSTDRARRGRHHRRRHLRAGRTGRALRRARPDALLRAVRPGLRVRRPLLCRIRRHDPAGRQRLHLRLRHAGRTVRLDHRLGSDARIRHGRQHRLFRLVQPLHRVAEYLSTSKCRCGWPTITGPRCARPKTSSPGKWRRPPTPSLVPGTQAFLDKVADDHGGAVARADAARARSAERAHAFSASRSASTCRHLSSRCSSPPSW